MTWEKSSDFALSDVIEWTEAIWPLRRSRRRAKPRPVGKQKLIGQITEIEGDFIKLIILKSAILENTVAKELLPHKVGSTLTKKRTTLLRGEPQRLHWSEEEVRAALLQQVRTEHPRERSCKRKDKPFKM